MFNLNEMAERIAAKEGGRLNLSIAQIKEVQRLTLEDLADQITRGARQPQSFAEGNETK